MQCTYVICNVCNALAWDIIRMKSFYPRNWMYLLYSIYFDIYQILYHLLNIRDKSMTIVVRHTNLSMLIILYLLDDICDTFSSPTITLKKKNKTKAIEYIWKLISFHNFSRKAFLLHTKMTLTQVQPFHEGCMYHCIINSFDMYIVLI